MKRLLRNGLGRNAIASALDVMQRWPRLDKPLDGFSIMLGVPWDLRHLLTTNLRFIEHTDTSELVDLHVVIDRSWRPGMDELIRKAEAEHPSLPLRFHFYPSLSGKIVESVHVSTFYNSMNCITALAACRTKWMVLHDFDLYPLRSDHFTGIVDAMRREDLLFAGRELTYYDGLTKDDGVLGTWALGMNAQWLRNECKAKDIFHRMAPVRGVKTNLDPFSYLEIQTSRKRLVESGEEMPFCHVKNLCSTYLRFSAGRPVKLAWRLHYLWYLEDLVSEDGALEAIVDGMRASQDGVLSIGGRKIPFADVHVTCANVLESELSSMDRTLFGAVRPRVIEYCQAFREFLERFGNDRPLATGRQA